MAQPKSLAFSSGSVNRGVYCDLFCQEIEKNPNGVLAKLCAPLSADEVRRSLNWHRRVVSKNVVFQVLEGWHRIHVPDEHDLAIYSETSGMQADPRFAGARLLVGGQRKNLQKILDDILSAAANPELGGPRSLTVIRKKMSVEREEAFAAIYADFSVPPNISVGKLDRNRRVLSAGKNLIGILTVGKELHNGAVIEAQLVRAPGPAKDHAASPHEVEGVIRAVNNWAAGRSVTGEQIQLRRITVPTQSATVESNWVIPIEPDFERMSEKVWRPESRAEQRSLVYASGDVSQRVFIDLFRQEIEGNPEGVLAKLCKPLTADEVHKQLEQHGWAQTRYALLQVLGGWDRVRLSDEPDVSISSEKGGMQADTLSRRARLVMEPRRMEVKQALEDILSAAAQPQYGGPRSLTVISHDMSVAREHAYAALYAEPAVPPNISVGELDGDRRVLFTDKGLIGTVTVGVELHKGPVIEAQLVRTPGTGKDCAALPHEVDAVIKAVDNWAAGRTATGRQIRPHKATMPTPSASVTQNWLA